jgi:hypothetical protein
MGGIFVVKTIILLTKSRKHGGYCTSGIDIESGKWIRIVSDGVGCFTDEITSSQLSYNNGEEAQIFDVIRINCIKHKPIYFQPENYLNDRTKCWEKIRETNFQEVIQLHSFENKEYIYFDTSYSINGSSVLKIDNQLIYSLILIKVVNPIINVKRWDNGSKSITLCFNYNGQYYNYFRFTDGFDKNYSDKCDGLYTLLGEFGLVISLGELHTDGKHYKLIAKLFELQ